MLRITNDTGVACNTKFTDVETGEKINLAVTKFSLHAEHASAPMAAKLDLALVRVDVLAGSAEWQTCHPVTGRLTGLRSLHFKDGTSVHFDENGTKVGCDRLEVVNAPYTKFYRAAAPTKDTTGYVEGAGE